MTTIRLQYLKGSKEKNAWMKQFGATDVRQWNVLSPVAGYASVPTFGIHDLQAKGLLGKPS